MTVPTTLTIEQHIRPDQDFTYLHLPFTVPDGIGRIDVAYTYDSAIGSDPELTGGNTIDIGLIDPHGSAFMTQGFRGWSGSARREFYVALDSATPGYLAGPIQAGTWSICLGAYKVAPEGCHCRVTITLMPGEPGTDTAVNFPALLRVTDTQPAQARLASDHWYRGEVHCHTVNSDGDSTPEEVIGIAEALGLDFLAITDHNNRSQLVELARLQAAGKMRLTLIPGYEVTTYYGHWNIWGEGEWIDFRIQSPDDLRRAIAEAQAQGYFVSCNHPRPHGPEWAFPEVDGYSAVEVWNGPWELLNDACLGFWDTRLKAGQRLVALGGSDFHFSKEPHIAHIGHPTLYVHCPEGPTAANLLRHMRSGHVFVTESPQGPRVDLSAGKTMMGDTLHIATVDDTLPFVSVAVLDGQGSEAQLYTAHGLVASYLINSSYDSFVYALDPASLRGARYIRAQVVDPHSGRCRAISNPIYLTS